MLQNAGIGVGLALALWLALAGCQRPDEFPAMALLERAEARLDDERELLRPRLGHYGLVFSISQAELAAFMTQIRVHGEGADLTLGVVRQPESHGGAVLALLLDHWRPEARLPRLDDRYPFEARPSGVDLQSLYDAYGQQIGLPKAGSDQLPRMRFQFAPSPNAVPLDRRWVEADAFAFLGALIQFEPDPSRVWRNRVGQSISLDRLMTELRRGYLASEPPDREPDDHSVLHVVPLLVAYEAAFPGAGLEEVRDHFVARELAVKRGGSGPFDEVQVHRMEALGALVSAEGLAWSEQDYARVSDWLRGLGPGTETVAETQLNHLTHLTKGLRALRDSWHRLDSEVQ